MTEPEKMFTKNVSVNVYTRVLECCHWVEVEFYVEVYIDSITSVHLISISTPRSIVVLCFLYRKCHEKLLDNGKRTKSGH